MNPHPVSALSVATAGTPVAQPAGEAVPDDPRTPDLRARRPHDTDALDPLRSRGWQASTSHPNQLPSAVAMRAEGMIVTDEALIEGRIPAPQQCWVGGLEPLLRQPGVPTCWSTALIRSM